MKQFVQESFYIDENEFYLLLAGNGVKKWYGLSNDQRDRIIDEGLKEDVYRALTGLYQKGYVDWNEDMVDINDQMIPIVETLKDAQYCMIVEKEQERKSYYLSFGKVVLVEKSRVQAGKMKLSIFSKEELIDIFLEEAYFPKKEECLDSDCSDPILWNEDDMYHIVSFVLLRADNGREIERIDIKESGLMTFTIWRYGLDREIMIYQKEWCYKKLYQWMNRRK